jgi:preprotein translocase subunit SecE
VSKFREYINETVHEMRHNVTWPTWRELQSNAIIVVVASVIIALLIFVMDFIFGNNPDPDTIWSGAMRFIYEMF